MSASESHGVNRRGFHELAMGALAGMLAGAGGSEAAAQPAPPKAKRAVRANLLLQEPNICRGLNICKGKGRGDGFGGPNKCVGQSVCATAPEHVCASHNTCRGLGACDEGDPRKYQVNYPGENTCQGLGACGVPIPAKKDHIWVQARRRFVAVLEDAGGRAGPAPPRPRGF